MCYIHVLFSDIQKNQGVEWEVVDTPDDPLSLSVLVRTLQRLQVSVTALYLPLRPLLSFTTNQTVCYASKLPYRALSLCS